MKDVRSLILNTIFFGALWGLLEASLGYALHFLPQLVSGSVMFPLGAIIMYWAYRNTGKKRVILYVAMVAASIKAINFFMPGLLPIKTYNPMISIMLQALLVIGFSYVYEAKQFVFKPMAILSVSLGWRALFIANIVINNALTGFVFPQLANTTTTLNFIFLSGLIEASFLMAAYLLSLLAKNRNSLVFKPNWILAGSTLVAAISMVVVNIVIA